MPNQTTEQLDLDNVSTVANVDDAATNELEICTEIVRAEIEGCDPGPLATNDDLKAIYRFARIHNRLTAELELIKTHAAAMIHQRENQLKALWYVYGGRVEDIVRKSIRGSRAKSLKTPFGVLGFRHVPPRLEVKDEQKVIALVEQNRLPEDVRRIKIEVSRSALGQYFKTSGDIPEGCDLIPDHDQFYCRG